MNAAELRAAGPPPHPVGNDIPPVAEGIGPIDEHSTEPAGSFPHEPPTARRVGDSDSKPFEFSPGVALSPCRKCGAPNGRTASVCWSCETDLAADGPLWFLDDGAPDDAAPEGADSSPSASIEPARSASPADAGRDATDVAAGTGPVGNIPMAAADAPPVPDADLKLPVLTSVVQDDDRMLAFARVRTRPRRLQLAIVSGFAVAAIAGVASLLVGRDAVFIALDDSPFTQRRATAELGAGGPKADALPTSVPAPNPPIDNGSPAVAVRDEAPATMVNPAATATDVPTPAPERRIQRASQNRPQPNALRAEASRQTTRPPLTGGDRSIAKTAPVARPLSVPPGPCTSAVSALGLCSAGQSPTEN